VSAALGNNVTVHTSEERPLFNPAKVTTTRPRYRGTAIPTPWPRPE
jgi:hypothetical protein